MNDEAPETPRPGERREQRRRSSLRVIVEESRMFFGAVIGVLEKQARSLKLLRNHAHRQKSIDTAMNANLELICRHLGIVPKGVEPEDEDDADLEELNGTDARW